MLERIAGDEPLQEGGYGLRDGMEVEHRKADWGSANHALQKARDFGERVRRLVARSARRGFPYSETRICQSAQRPYSSTRWVSHAACVTGWISSRFTSQNRWLDRACIAENIRRCMGGCLGLGYRAGDVGNVVNWGTVGPDGMARVGGGSGGEGG